MQLLAGWNLIMRSQRAKVWINIVDKIVPIIILEI